MTKFNKDGLVDNWQEVLKATKSSKYEQAALLYAEKYGIIEYTIKGNKMVYYVTYPTEGTYKHTVDLRTLKETVVGLKRRRKVGVFNRG